MPRRFVDYAVTEVRRVAAMRTTRSAHLGHQAWAAQEPAASPNS